MKRWIVKGGATSLDQLVLEEVAIPGPGVGQVRVKVHAVSLNRRDLLLVTGAYGVAPSDFVAVSDGAGEVDAVGPDVTEWAIGDRVTGNYYPSWADGPPAPDQGWGLGSPGQDGMLAEYVILDARRLTAAPETLSFEEAACLPCAGLTAWTALHGNRPYTNRISQGDKVLVTGTGSVSVLALLLAKAAGADVVATTGSDSKIESIKALGAGDVIHYGTDANWGERAAEGVGGFNRVVNAAGSASLDQCIVALAPGGEIALMGLFEHAEAAPNFVLLMMKGGSIRGISVGSAMAYRDLVDFVDRHGIKPPIARRFTFSEAREAYQALETSSDLGKIVIMVAGRVPQP
ncbi:hypothetical protein BZG35_04010 [Brevundimonas sp. LM2]|uniref:zinc-dependent alcohol dehydrogenase family protein n=1 Tax=Brevundimonas sp. LM2 TaxID=1938605 RepID=UPI000983B0A6|nr:NAD(P)-dependent alcohol dehydrogenase [Brevundimonas sp. LM2]AQR60908.1 hypothetical protein BZG35_04010 [Brevundimonas sp. LM2]